MDRRARLRIVKTFPLTPMITVRDQVLAHSNRLARWAFCCSDLQNEHDMGGWTERTVSEFLHVVVKFARCASRHRSPSAPHPKTCHIRSFFIFKEWSTTVTSHWFRYLPVLPNSRRLTGPDAPRARFAKALSSWFTWRLSVEVGMLAGRFRQLIDLTRLGRLDRSSEIALGLLYRALG